MKRKTTKPDALPAPVPADLLRVVCDADDLGFETTRDLEASQQMLGQDRAVDAIALSADIRHQDFNLYVLGQQGTGRHAAVSTLLSQAAGKRKPPSDWIYVNNFEAAHKPHAIALPTGEAVALKTAMQTLVDDLAHEIPAMFDSEEYQTKRRTIEREIGERHEVPLAEFAEEAQSEDVALLRTPMGFMLAAIHDGNPIKPDIYEKMDPQQRQQIDEKIERLQDKLAEILRQGPELEKEHRQRLEDLHVAMAERVVSVRMSEVIARFSRIAPVAAYLERVRKDMISNAELFLVRPADGENGPFPDAIRKYHREPQFVRYAVNVMVSNTPETRTGAPVVTEDLPTMPHLTGRIDHVSEMGTLITNFTLIKPGALHRANGGYLVLEAARLLSEPYAWEALKRCIRSQKITITSLADRLSLTSTVSLEPDPIALNVRVVLIGDRRLHMLLQMLDPDFNELFKLQADFEDDLPRTKKTMRQFARRIGTHARSNAMLPLSSGAVARLLDQSVRIADDSQKFSLRIGVIADIMSEADHYARKSRRKLITRDDVDRAIDEGIRRASRIRDRIHDAVIRKTILIDTAGAAVGQINGLSVLSIGSHAFGRPSRITARVRMGTGKLVDIEREVELGGPLHSKGVLILAGYLSATYALDFPMSLQASLVFEQSYGGVDGDSASSAELYALLSALSQAPIAQGLAVTGSVNQAGQVQAIGGVNEKIEGFFDVCKARRLTGKQGVLIPAANVEHLMLRPDIVEAARAGKFKVIPVTSIDEGIALLTGTPAGRRDRSGQFPEGTINARVEERLLSFAQTRKAFAAPPAGHTDESTA